MKKLKEMLRTLVSEESKLKSISVKATTLEEALQKGCEELGLNISEIDYEIEEFGNKGVFGVGKKDFVVKIYRASSKSEMLNEIISGNILETDEEFDLIEKMVDSDGEAFVRVTSRGVLLKVTPPIGKKGKKFLESRTLEMIEARGITNFDRSAVKKIVKEAAGEYCKIGKMQSNIMNDSSAAVRISMDEMKAFLTLTPPKPGGFDLEKDEIQTILHNNKIVVGIKSDVIDNLIDYPEYDKEILVAEGIKPIPGQDAHVDYKFHTERKINLKESDNGKVDFKELNLVQNVVEGQLLASKVPLKKGEPGRTVTNRLLTASNGKDIELVGGANTRVSDNGLEILAAINGQVLIKGGKVVVDPVMVVNGDVGIKLGNIIFLGTVIVKGSVDDGYNVKATGNIEIHGTVGKSLLEADGDIIVNQGVLAKDEGSIIAGGSVFAKFVENVKLIDAGNSVIIQDSIMSSNIDAVKEIKCQGKRGAIVGGRLRAGELIESKTLGSKSETETIFEVGIDPKKRQKRDDLEKEKNEANKKIEPINANFNRLEIQKKDMGDLPPNKQEIYDKLIKEKRKYDQIIDNCQKEIDIINDYFKSLKAKGKVIGSKVVYPGVKIYIKESTYTVKTEFQRVCFVLQGSEVGTIPLENERDRRGR